MGIVSCHMCCCVTALITKAWEEVFICTLKAFCELKKGIKIDEFFNEKHLLFECAGLFLFHSCLSCLGVRLMITVKELLITKNSQFFFVCRL